MNNVESKSRKSNIKKDKVKCSLSPAHMAIKHLLDSIDFSSAVSARECQVVGEEKIKNSLVEAF